MFTKFLNNISFFKKISLFVSLTLLVFGIFGIITVIFSNEKVLTGYFASELNQSATEIFAQIDLSKQKALNATEWFQKSPRIIKAIKDKNKESLIELGKLAINSMALDYLVVTDDKGNVLARAHEPDKFGDNIAEQVNIKKALNKEKSVGIETGNVVKLSIRAGTPIIDENGSMIGTISLGFILSNNNWVDQLKKYFYIDVTVFHKDERIATTLMLDGKRLVGTKLDNPLIIKTVLQEGKAYIGNNTIQGKKYLTQYLPLKDVNNEVAGMIFVGKNLSLIKELSFNIAVYVISLSLLLFAIILLFTLKFAKLLSLPLLRISQHLNQIANGDYSIPVSKHALNRKDENGIIANALHNLNISMGKTFGKIITDAKKLSNSASNLNSDSKDLSSQAQQVSSSVNSLSSTSEQQSQQMQQMSEHIKELKNQVVDTSDKALHVAKFSQETIATAKQGNEKMLEMIQAMKNIQISGNDIAKIIRVIDDVAFQTNLLALNAAVEAARAGAHGKGFAVVAGEVRNLAQRSAKAAKETTDIIQDSNEKINQGVAISQNTEIALGKIIAGTNTATELITNISDSCQKQAKEIQSFSVALDEINQGTQANVANLEEISTSIANVSETAKNVLEESNKLSEESAEMQKMISLFKIMPSEINKQ